MMSDLARSNAQAQVVPSKRGTAPAKKAASSSNEDKVDPPVGVSQIKPAKKRNMSEKKQKASPERRDSARTIFVEGFNDNLAYETIEKNLETHFSICGKVKVDIPLSDDGTRFAGHAFVEFENSDSFHRALSINGSQMNGDRLYVEDARYQAYNIYAAQVVPSKSGTAPAKKAASSSNEDKVDPPVGVSQIKSAKKRNRQVDEELMVVSEKKQKASPERRDSALTIFVEGFNDNLAHETIKNDLVTHFSICGKVTMVDVPLSDDGTTIVGHAFVEFENSGSFHRALSINGSRMKGYRLYVEDARRTEDIS